MSKFRLVCAALLMVHLDTLVNIVNPAMVVKIVRMSCDVNPSYITNDTCVLKPVSRHKAVFNMDGDIVKTLRNVSIHMQIFRQNDANRYQPFMVNTTINMCDILARKSFVIYGTLAKKALTIFSNMNHSCPYTGHIMVRNAFFDERYRVGFLMPNGVYKGIFIYYEGYPYQKVGVFTLYVNVYETR